MQMIVHYLCLLPLPQTDYLPCAVCVEFDQRIARNMHLHHPVICAGNQLNGNAVVLLSSVSM